MIHDFTEDDSNDEMLQHEENDVLALGETWQEKIARLRNHMNEKEADAVVVTALDDSACKLLTFDVI